MAGPGWLRHSSYCTFSGAGDGSLSSSKSSHCQEVPLPSCLEGQRLMGMGWIPAFSSNYFFTTRGNCYRGTGSCKNENLSGLRKVQGKIVLWFIVFLSHVFYYMSWQRSSEIKKKSFLANVLHSLSFFWCGMTEIPVRWILASLKRCADCNKNSRTQKVLPIHSHCILRQACSQHWWHKSPLCHGDFDKVDTLISYPKSLISFLWSLFHGRKSIRVGDWL